MHTLSDCTRTKRREGDRSAVFSSVGTGNSCICRLGFSLANIRCEPLLHSPAAPTSGRHCVATSSRARQANMLGALALAVTDGLHERLVAADERGLSATAALIHLRLRPGENIDFLARVLDISHPATVRLVDRLEADGLVERRPGPDA